ncbi:hypothetical protein [Bacillus mycoides]|uniref:hypothetical protein n=1 Tax=Bacillus mycoides TaxID=1405 RepID=UPI000BEF530B|nr:hypothetical protein [Bacillus mycoides]PEK94253.1 hypothetical protein CN600_11570 [Bacillus mycoides]
MKKKEFKENFKELFSKEVEDYTNSEKISLIKSYLVEIEKEQSYDEINKGKPWSDEELRVIFSFAPNKENIIKLAKAFKRGSGSIEQIYRWAATPYKKIEEKGKQDNEFILQLKRISKECGWIV